jgi:hypothetical protein
MVELILASANEVLCLDAQADLDAVAGLLPRLRADADLYLDYWRGLDDDDEFPLGAWLRRRD